MESALADSDGLPDTDHAHDDVPVDDRDLDAETTATSPEPDLDAIDRDLDGVETALRRLDDGTYWTDEVTGEPIDDDVLATDPTARRAAD